MGIRGLTTFIDDNQESLLSAIKLREELVVIDGCSLYFHLYDLGKLNVRCGGDYASFRKVISEFFEKLRTCHIYAVVVLDGAFDPDKRTTQLRRLESSVENLPLLMNGLSSTLVMPILASEVFQQVLEELHIPFVYSFFDADRDVASIANALDAYVLSKDSDFYVLPVNRGYISFSYFRWKQVINPTLASPHMICHVYTTSQLASYYHMNSSLLVYLPAILGCDYMESGTLLKFGCANFWNDEAAMRKEPNMFRDKKFRSVFRFFAETESYDDIFEMIETYYKSDEKVVAKLKWCLDYYQNPPSTAQCQTVLKGELEKLLAHISSASLKDSLISRMETLEDDKIEDHVVLRARCGKYPTSMFSIYSGNRTVLLPVVVGSGSNQQSMHSCSYAIRSATYQLITNEVIVEYNQQSNHYSKTKLIPKHKLCSCQTLQNVIESSSRFSEHRNDADAKILRQYILETLLGCRIANSKLHERFNEFVGENVDFEILLGATMHWVAKTKPPFFILSALLLALADPGTKHCSEILPKLRNAVAKTCSVQLIHRLSEWQSCLKFVLVLNRTLSSPLQEPQITFNCTVIAALSHHIMKQNDVRSICDADSLGVREVTHASICGRTLMDHHDGSRSSAFQAGNDLPTFRQIRILFPEHEAEAARYNQLLSVVEPNSKYSMATPRQHSSGNSKSNSGGRKSGGGRRRRGRR